MENKETVAIPSAKPRCYLLYAIAPEGVNASLANKTINELIADPETPLALWHDHFLGGPGGSAIFCVANKDQQKALFENDHLTGWSVHYQPLVFSFSPSAFDAQIDYTTKVYGGRDWHVIRVENSPDYTKRNTQQEAESVRES